LIAWQLDRMAAWSLERWPLFSLFASCRLAAWRLGRLAVLRRFIFDPLPKSHIIVEKWAAKKGRQAKATNSRRPILGDRFLAAQF
jgi:hypothetical protein